MKLYPKKLNNIAELQKEQKKLTKQAKELDKEDLFSLDNLVGRKGSGKGRSKDEEDGGMLSNVIEMLPIGNPRKDGPESGTTLSPKKNGSSKGRESIVDTAKKKGMSILRTGTIEILSGYLKWKAIQLSYKGISHIIKTRREEKKHEEQMHNL